MNLAQQLALDMADGRTARLPRLTRNASPEFARDLLGALYRLRDGCAQIRRDEGATWDLRDRIAFSLVAQEVEDAIVDARRWLSRLARLGGHGVPLASATGAGRSPAVDGPRMARSGGAGAAGTVAAGAAATEPARVADTTPASPLFAFARKGSSCHRLQPGATLKAAQEAACT